jgi:mannose-6-phosphate isomerase-like protein (cupin superfamily)
MKKLKKILLYVISFILLYLFIGYLLHLLIFPETEVRISEFFQPGDTLYISAEKIQLTVIKQEPGKVFCHLEAEAHAPGPPMHIHSGFDEVFKVDAGELSVIVDGDKRTLKAGEKYTIEQGTPHKSFNETDSSVYATMTDEEALPEAFFVYLSQIYGYIDESEENMKPPKVILQMAMFQQYFDSYLDEGPPVAIQKTMNFLIVHLERLLGYQSFYDKYDIRDRM